jgi:hypothetical protein
MGVGVSVGDESGEGFVNVLQGWCCGGRSSGSGVWGQIRVLLSSEREMFGNEEEGPA